MMIVWFLAPKPFQLFMVKKGLHPETIVHPKSLELLGQGEICEDHIMDINSSELVSSQLENHLPKNTCCPDRYSPQIFLEMA